MKKQRLDKFISSQSGISRSEAKNAVRSGFVTVNSAVCKNCADIISPDSDTVCFNGQAMEYREFVYLLLNKPKGILSASNDKSRKTVIDLMPEKYRRRNLFPVGRLDKDTTGMLIITDDGAFAHDLISPSKKIPKTYLVGLDGPLPSDAEEKFLSGITLADGTLCRPARLKPLEDNFARLTLTEGKYHEVKRMFGTLGLGVDLLHRESIGALCLPEELKLGECVEMSENWLNLVRKMEGYAF